MANMHILTQDRGLYRIAAHIAIPVGNNSAGVSWRTALINSGLGGSTVLIDGDGTAGTISSAEKSSIASGALYEDVGILEVVHDSSTGGSQTTQQLATIVDAYFTARTTAVLASLQAQLTWFGQTR